MLECVINLSEGRDLERVARIAAAAGASLLDLHTDPHHNRSVLTVVGEHAARAVTTAGIGELDLRDHQGVHPRLGVVDVVPFVALDGSTDAEALQARDGFANWLSEVHGVPCFLYGPERSLPDVRRHAFRSLAPDMGPPAPHPRAGATAVGQRGVLVAFNLWLEGADLSTVREIAATVRDVGIRALGLQVGERLQVSMNLTDPALSGPADAADRVTALATTRSARVVGAELVGLVPQVVLDAVPPDRWAELDLSASRTIEARLRALADP
ncbi:MAG: hypothetical protein WD691_01160 [Acidimicrobiales bacterium]